MLLNLAAQRFSQGRRSYDRGGKQAARGEVDRALLNSWLRHPFLRKRPPKSTGRECFGEDYFQSLWQAIRSARLSQPDALATLTQFTADSIALNYKLHLEAIPHRVVLAGGGAANTWLVHGIQEALRALDSRVQVMTCLELGWPWQSVEPAAFAWLAWLRWRRLPAHHPETTGASKSVLLGQVTEV